ncbi:pentapeptide repeat-containing protein [Anaerostipes faecalis]|uniref:pentapeptide repeat-containing protein n=1 Tax=Anaerostipes faecalis TaxID=2738446 RepID=UPI003F0F3D36
MISKIVSEIFNIVVKSIFKDEVDNSLLSLPIEFCSEKSVSMITTFINERKHRIEYILSNENMKTMNISESNFDFVVAEITDLLDKVKINDDVLERCGFDDKKLTKYLYEKYFELNSKNIECENDIKKGISIIALSLVATKKECTAFVNDILLQINSSVDETNVEVKKIYGYLETNFEELNKNNQEILVRLNTIKEQNNIAVKKEESRTVEYAQKWNENMFLNNFDKRDENAGINIKLSEVYLEKHLPHYKWRENKKISKDLKNLLSEYIEFSEDNKMLLILGQPGIGKSTLLTWITANFNERVDNIIIYQFAPDLKNVDWKSHSISEKVLERTGLTYKDLYGKTLILDGFDELSLGERTRQEVLDGLYDELIYKKKTKHFTLIITCRENYIRGIEKLKCQYITLQAWDKGQIESFCTVFQRKTQNEISKNTMDKLYDNKDILGIPLILYMVLALNISIEKEGSIVDVYDRIFSLEGGIYDRCIENKKFADSHRTGEVKRQIHQISREIAFWMFENNPNEASIPQQEYEKICTIVMISSSLENQDIKYDFKIGSYFKAVKHCEGVEAEDLFFVHRSIYEYFVVDAIFVSIEKSIVELSESKQEELAENIAFYLKSGMIDYVIGKYLMHKIMKVYGKLDYEKKNRFYDWWEMTVGKMVKQGMFYFSQQNICHYNHIMGEEISCFLNLLEILRLLLKTGEHKYILTKCNSEELIFYIKCCSIVNGIGNKTRIPNLSKMYLNGKKLQWSDLSRTNVSNANLSYACLDNSNLKHSLLSGSEFTGANLYKVNMEDANLNMAKLNHANLNESVLSGAQFEEAEMKGTCLRHAILINAKFKGAKMLGADLEGAVLLDADLRGADIENINLNNALIEGLMLDEHQYDYLNGKYDLSQARVFCEEENENRICHEHICIDDGLRWV